MTRNFLTQPEQNLKLPGISWQTYQRLMSELITRRLRFTYNRGILEIMGRSPDHEIYKKLLGRFVETLAEELRISLYPLGSTTCDRSDLLCGLEPDECFYIQNQMAVKGKKHLDLIQDPPPDLVIEIDLTNQSKHRLEIFRKLGVPEIWCYDGVSLTIYQLQNKSYIPCEQSLAFRTVPVEKIDQFLVRTGIVDYLDLVDAFRRWVKSHVQP